VLIRSVSVCPFRRSLVAFVMASIVLWRLRAVSKSWAIMVTGVSLVPAVRLPSSKMRLFCVWVAIWVWSHLSRRVVMRVCMWRRLGTAVCGCELPVSFWSWLYWLNRL